MSNVLLDELYNNAESIRQTNRKSQYHEMYQKLWDSYGFREPFGVTSKFKYDRNANLDLEWAHLHGLDTVVFYSVFVQPCVFNYFSVTIKMLRDMCRLLRYCCVCDENGDEHVHYILAVLIEHKTTVINSLIPKSNLKKVPYDLHIQLKPITSAFQLFESIAYICQRSVDDKHEIAERSSHRGSHFYIFRSIIQDAPFWFFLAHRDGLAGYMHTIIQNKQLFELFPHITCKTGFPTIQYKYLLSYVPSVYLPIEGDQCINIDRETIKPYEDFKHLKYKLTDTQAEFYFMIADCFKKQTNIIKKQKKKILALKKKIKMLKMYILFYSVLTSTSAYN